MSRDKPLVGIGSCVVGEPVRFNGDQRLTDSDSQPRDYTQAIAVYAELRLGTGETLQHPREGCRQWCHGLVGAT